MTRATGFRFVTALAALLTLAGCLSDVGGHVAPRFVDVTSRDVTIMGPAGFCVDPQSSRPGRDRAFVVLGSCAAIADEPTLPQPDVPVVLTAAVVRGRAVSPVALDAYFRAHKAAQASRSSEKKTDSLPGSAASGKQGSVLAGLQVLDVALRDDVVYLNFRDNRDDGGWRGILCIDPDVTITLGLRTIPGIKVSKATQLATLREFAEQIARANGGRVIGRPRA